jgi:predicted transcriptional regulator of viral defense system
MEPKLAGLGKLERARLAQLLSAGETAITPASTASILQIDRKQATQLLALWARKGWLSRVKHGVYVPVSLQSQTNQVTVDDPWLLASSLFVGCTIGGWSAAEHWNLTEQIFNATMVFTTKKAATLEMNLNGARFILKTVTKQKDFGSKLVWRGTQKARVSDPTKTVVDAFNDPSVTGGVRMATDILTEYMMSDFKDLKLLFDYALQMKNSAIFKRIGFVFESKFRSESRLIASMKKEIKSGYSQFDPATPGESLITSWNLWVPRSWKNGALYDDQS